MRHDRVQQLLQTAEGHTRGRRYRRAVVAYRRVLALAPAGDYRHELAQVRLADLHLALAQPRPAIAHLQRARGLCDEPEPEYALMLSQACHQAGRMDEASLALHEVVDSPTHGGQALRALAGVMADAGDRAGARRLAAHATRWGDDPAADAALARDLADA